MEAYTSRPGEAGAQVRIRFKPRLAALMNPTPGPPTALAQGGLFPIAAVEKVDAQLKGVVSATYFGGSYNLIKALAIDPAGNVYIGGYTDPQGLPTRTPFQGGFSTTNGFLSELSGDLSTLLFSSYLGDAEHFAVQALAASPNGNIVIGGATGQADSYSSGPMNIYVNSLALAPPPALRIDAVENAASLLDGPISAGETIVVSGAGFGNNPQLLIAGTAVAPISTTTTTITAVVPQSIPAGAAQFQVQTAGGNSNSVADSSQRGLSWRICAERQWLRPGLYSEQGWHAEYGLKSRGARRQHYYFRDGRGPGLFHTRLRRHRVSGVIVRIDGTLRGWRLTR